MLKPFVDRNRKKADLRIDDTPAKAENIIIYREHKSGPEIRDNDSPYEVFDSSSNYEVV
jgi:hypothetical protein